MMGEVGFRSGIRTAGRLRQKVIRAADIPTRDFTTLRNDVDGRR